MVDWGVVAAFCGPLIGAIGATGGWFAWIGKRRDQRTADLIVNYTTKLENNQKLLEVRIDQVEAQQKQTNSHLDRQDNSLAIALQAIARIEGRLMGQVHQGTTEALGG